MALLALAMLSARGGLAAQVTYTTYGQSGNCFGATQDVFQSSDTSDCIDVGQAGKSMSYAARGLASECTTKFYHDATCKTPVDDQPYGISGVRVGFAGCFYDWDLAKVSGGQDLYAQTTCR